MFDAIVFVSYGKVEIELFKIIHKHRLVSKKLALQLNQELIITFQHIFYKLNI